MICYSEFALGFGKSISTYMYIYIYVYIHQYISKFSGNISIYNLVRINWEFWQKGTFYCEENKTSYEYAMNEL
jgi:hypothetical protein